MEAQAEKRSASASLVASLASLCTAANVCLSLRKMAERWCRCLVNEPSYRVFAASPATPIAAKQRSPECGLAGAAPSIPDSGGSVSLCTSKATKNATTMDRMLASAALVASHYHSADILEAGAVKQELSINQILKVAKLRVTDFCKGLDRFIAILGRDLDVDFIEQARCFTISSVQSFCMFRKYEKLFRAVLMVSAGSSLHEQESLFGFGWMLFLTAKAEIIGTGADSCDLHQMFMLLLCVVQSLSDGDSSQGQRFSQLKEDPRLYKDVVAFDIGRFQVYLRELVQEGILQAHKSADHSCVLGIQSSENLSSNVHHLSHHYDRILSNFGFGILFWLDERVFLEDIETITSSSMDPASSSSPPNAKAKISMYQPNLTCHQQPTHMKQQHNSAATEIEFALRPRLSRGIPFSAFSPVLISPSRPSAPTPVSRMMEAVSWLSSSYGSADDSMVAKSEYASKMPAGDAQPSATLCRHLAACSNDPLSMIQDLISDLTARTNFGSLRPEVSAFRRHLACKLFYKTLERMVETEINRLKGKSRDFSFWLGNRLFIVSVLACCFEIVMFSYKVASCLFPKILEIFQAPAFEMFKVIRAVCRTDAAMPPSVRSHLRDVEQVLLESLAWRASDGFHQLLQDSQVRSFVKCAFNSTTHAGPVAKTPGSPSANQASALLFIRQVASLCAERIDRLCMCPSMRLQPGFARYIMSLLVRTLTYHPDIFINRHIDSVILCCIFSVCKVSPAKVQFASIVSSYLNLFGHNSVPVVQSVYLSTGEGQVEHGSVIRFYNSVFMPALKEFILGEIKTNVLNHMQRQGVIQATVRKRPRSTSSPGGSPRTPSPPPSRLRIAGFSTSSYTTPAPTRRSTLYAFTL